MMAVLSASLACALSQPTGAQTIRGQVVDSLSGQPVGAGFVVLIGENSEEISRTLTSPDGSFSFDLRGDQRGHLRLRSERIGYRLSISEPFATPSGDLDGLVVYVMALPTQLETIEARDASECRIRPSDNERTAVVWEEARKALSAAAWTASRHPYRVVSNMYTADMDGPQRNVTNESHPPSIGLSTNPFVSRSPNELVQAGYVTEESDSYVYTSPDAHVFQSDAFLDTHCFRLTEGDDEGLIGVAFQPVPSRRLPDVDGVLWIDRATWELRSLQYEYTNLPPAIRVEDPAGGSVAFVQLPSGAWIVRQWDIQFPTAFREQRIGVFDRRARQRVETLRRVGGEVLTIHEPGGGLVYETDFAEVVGVVRDGTRGGDVLAGAVVSVPNTWFADTADQFGRFHLRVPLTGEYTIAATHPRIDSLVFGPPPVPITLTRGEIVETSLVVPTLEELFAKVCTDRPPSADHRVVVGIVIDSATATPIRGAAVVAQWQHITPRLDFFNRQTVSTTDDLGRYALCGLEVARPSMVYAVSSTGLSEVLRVAFEPWQIEIRPFAAIGGDTEVYPTPSRIWRRDLTIGRGAGTLLAGSIVDATTGTPIAGVEVWVSVGAVRTRTDSLGTFRLTGLAPGHQRLELKKRGYATRWGNVTLADDQPTNLGGADMALTPVPQLFGVVQEGDSGRPLPLAWMTLVNANGDSLTRARSDSLGRFTVTAPREGAYSVVVARLGFASQTMGPFELRAGAATETIVTMSPGVFALDPIRVTAEAPDQYLRQVGFYQRQRANRGHFMDRADIEERLGSSPDAFQLMAALPGVGVADASTDQQGSRISLSRGIFSFAGCGQGPLIYVDGFRVEYGGNGGQPSYDAIGMVARPEDIQAIEVFRTPSQIPVQYSGPESACGVILIWTWKGGGDGR